jgi:GWxTD domain-containing protein
MRLARFHTLTLPLLLALLSLPCWPAHARTIHNLKPYEKWLNEDVRWIINDQERAEFEKLSDDIQRDQFVEAFWERRNPTPGATGNTFKEEHYRRLAYSNEHFAQGIPGWKTDRGRFYVMYGPPDNVVRHVAVYRAPRPGELQKGAYNSEEWRWKYIEGLGCNVILVFEDTCGCGEYHLSLGEIKYSSEEEVAPVLHLGPGCSIDKVLFP